MNNWKLRSVITGTNTDDLVEVNGYLAAPSTTDVPVLVVPFGNHYAASLRTSASDNFGPVSNQVPGICNGTFTHTGAASGNVASTTLTGEGSGAFFNYTFLADGTLSTITANTGGSNYKVGDKLRITTSASHGSQDIEFRLVDGSNAVSLGITIPHDRNAPLPYAVHRARVNSASTYTFHVYDYRSSQVFPKPQDKLLDKYPDAAAAYGLRLLRSAYLGPAIKVRRDSDNATKDIGFSGGNLDTATLLAFAGSQTVTVDTWYDQSGGSNDATQSTNASQPTIVNGGALVTVNGKPALDFDGSDDRFGISGFTNAASDYGVFCVVQANSATAGGRLFDTQTGRMVFDARQGGTGAYYDGGWRGDGFTHLNQAVTSLHLISPSSGATYVDGVATNLSQPYTQKAIGGLTSLGSSENGSTGHWDGTMQEVVIYAADKTSDRKDIEKDMGLFYSAYGVEDAPLLDAYGGAHAAYSLRKLNSDYTGAAIRVRRVGNDEQDIGFDANGHLDLVALRAFSDNNCTIKTWYDQSGGGNDVTQSTIAKQPRIMDSDGTVFVVDGRPAALFNGIAHALPFDNTGLDIGNLSSFAVMKYSDTDGSEVGLGLSGGVGNKRWYSPYLLNGNFNYGYGSVVTAVNTTANTNNNLHTQIAGATQTDMEAFLNGSSVGTTTLATGIDNTNGGIGNLSGAFHMNGFIQEVVVYSSDQSERREGIERNISNHYDL